LAIGSAGADITIDFGDGRKLERTITATVFHYVLDAEGRPIDALPGLYGPAAFLRALAQTEAVFQQLAQATESERASRLAAYHRQSISALNLQWLADTRMIGGRMPQGFRVVQNPDGKPTALQSTTLAMTKRVTEVNVLRSMTAGSEALGALTDEAAWNKLGSAALRRRAA